jgi:transposase
MKSRKSPSNDNKDFIPLLKKMPLIQAKEVAADKGYDCEANHRFVLNELNAEPLIPVKKNLAGCHNNKLRKRMKRLFDLNPSYLQNYHQRSKVETIFSVMKRKFGDVLFSRSMRIKKKELKLRVILYDIYRIDKLEEICIIKVFIRADKEKMLCYPVIM